VFSRARRQLTIVYALTGIALYTLLAVAIMLTVVSVLDREIDRDIQHVLAESSGLVAQDQVAAPTSTALDVPIAFGPIFLFAFNPQGEVVRNPRDLPAYRVVPAADVRLSALRGERIELTRSVEGGRYRLHLLPAYEHDEVIGVLVAGRSLARRDTEVRIFAVILLTSGAVWSILASASAYVIAGRALTPVRDAYARQEEFVAGAAHELRSPIGVIRAASDVALRAGPSPEVQGMLTEISEVAQDASDLVDNLLELARIRPVRVDVGETCEMSAVVARELARMDLLLQKHDVRVLDDLVRVRARVPEGDVARVVRVLLENVLQHTPSGTQALVRTRQINGMATLTVEDTGPGLPPEQIGTVFDMFTRGDESRRRGERRTGLGLAIVQSVASHYGGSVLARAPVLGTGLVIEVSFPAA